MRHVLSSLSAMFWLSLLCTADFPHCKAQKRAAATIRPMRESGAKIFEHEKSLRK
jgi:hypothetical protein